jgi:hypothetical protein
MGQQQLLLLVLATVIVGLATVAGIQAFEEGQSQATQDALIQRATSIGTDILSVYEKPPQLGGVSTGSSVDTSSVKGPAGLPESIQTPGAGNGWCKVETKSYGALVKCTSASGRQANVRVKPNTTDSSKVRLNWAGAV